MSETAANAGRRPHSGSLDERPGREPGAEYLGGDAWVASQNGSGTSIFDPVLCELLYHWFCPPAGQVLDPFAGGSVRGIVAAHMGRKYWGCDLREEQLAANREQAAIICPTNPPTWFCGDSTTEISDHAPYSDFIFSCPPYGDLERYSDDPKDLSTMEYPKFVTAYRTIVAAACGRLAHNRFAAFVVGEFRDGRGHYRNFVGDTVEAFRAAGLRYYNEAILITAVGSLPLRVGKQFSAGRKLGKTHQNVLIFLKGDSEIAARACGRIEEAPQ
jgi:DNA modification methylase